MKHKNQDVAAELLAERRLLLMFVRPNRDATTKEKNQMAIDNARIAAIENELKALAA